jgi:CRP-like cAMP-binding protein
MSMASLPLPPIHGNRLLAAMSPGDQALLAPALELKEFALRQVFEMPNRPIKHVYFIDRGMASVVARGNGDDHVEVGLIGREGASGVSVILGGDRSPHYTYAQLAGAGHRIGAGALRDSMEVSPTLRALLLKFAHTFMIQTAQTALANGRAKLEARLARWILMGHDRINGDQLPLTHEFLSVMLGVRRAGVTVALHLLQERGLIRTQRSHIAIVDRKGLEHMTNGAYGVPENEYRRLIG